MKNNINIYHFSSALTPYTNVRMGGAKSYKIKLNDIIERVLKF